MSESVVGVGAVLVISESLSESPRADLGVSNEVMLAESAAEDSSCCKFWQAVSNSGSSAITMLLINVRKSSARKVSKCI